MLYSWKCMNNFIENVFAPFGVYGKHLLIMHTEKKSKKNICILYKVNFYHNSLAHKMCFLHKLKDVERWEQSKIMKKTWDINP